MTFSRQKLGSWPKYTPELYLDSFALQRIPDDYKSRKRILPTVDVSNNVSLRLTQAQIAKQHTRRVTPAVQVQGETYELLKLANTQVSLLQHVQNGGTAEKNGAQAFKSVAEEAQPIDRSKRE